MGLKPFRGLSSTVVFAGGVLGTAVRAALESALPAQPGGWPWTTFAINVSGSFLLGLLLETLSRRGPDAGPRRYLRLGLGTGVMGGYTTYSTFAVEAAELGRAGSLGLVLLYGAGSVLLGLGLAYAGGWGVRHLHRRVRR